MNTSALFLHLANLLAPAWGMAALLAPALAWHGRARPFWREVAGHLVWLAGIGSAVLIAGLAALGRDGAMVTYVALVVAMGGLAAWRDGVWRR
ncbi:MAG: hypothetical protein ACUVVU_03480 [Tepidimonas sp.]|uniref:hypothetical protein n=1 Tax=Tepidimonas sp. TaxID=2002775 RepID=UPI004054B5F0